MRKRKWKRVDDVVRNFMLLPYCENLSEDMKKIVTEAVRYGFRAGNSYGRYSMWGEMYMKEEMAKLLAPIDPTKYIVTENGNVIK